MALKKSDIAGWLVVLAISSPIWLYYVTGAFYQTACAIGNSGIHINEPFRVDAFTFERRVYPQRSYYGQWTAGPEFIARCDAKCANELAGAHGPFSYHWPWSVVRKGGIAIENTWELLPQHGQLVKHARLWVTSAGSAECLTTLYESGKPTSLCIAGKEIESISARYVVSAWPFTRKPHRLDPEGPSSIEWSFLWVQKHQHRLLKDGKAVARYVWYEKLYMNNDYLFRRESCPHEIEDGPRAFWTTVLDPKGAQPSN